MVGKWILLIMELIGFIILCKVKKDTQFLRLNEWKKSYYFFMVIGAFFAFLPVAGAPGIGGALSGFIVILGLFSLALVLSALATAKKRKVTYNKNLYDKDTFHHMFDEISAEDFEYYKDSLTDLFQRIGNTCRDRSETFKKQGAGLSGQSIFRGIRLFFRSLFFRSAVTTTTGMDPMFMSSDVTGIATAFRTESGFKYICAKELAAGVKRYLDLLESPDPEKQKFAVQSGAAFYLEIQRSMKDRLMDEMPCYAVQIAYFLCQYAKTFNRQFYDKMNRFIGPEFHLSVDINIVREIFSLYDSRTGQRYSFPLAKQQ